MCLLDRELVRYGTSWEDFEDMSPALWDFTRIPFTTAAICPGVAVFMIQNPDFGRQFITFRDMSNQQKAIPLLSPNLPHRPSFSPPEPCE